MASLLLAPPAALRAAEPPPHPIPVGPGPVSTTVPVGLATASATPCSITLSGALSGTYQCIAMTSWTSTSNIGGVTLSVLNPAPLTQLNVAIQRPGKPASGTWTQKDTGAKSTLVVGASGVPPPTWAASAGQATVQGSYSLTLVLASAAPTTSSSNGAIYAAHGTITAMLVPVATTSASGILTFSATF